MIPTGGMVTQNTQTVEQSSRTWKLDFDQGRVVGSIDGLEAVRQAVLKIIQTGRFVHLVYSADYGGGFASLVGRNPLLVQTELRRQIREALIQDDRIADVRDINVDIVGDTATINFTVISAYGSFQEEVEVGV